MPRLAVLRRRNILYPAVPARLQARNTRSRCVASTFVVPVGHKARGRV